MKARDVKLPVGPEVLELKLLPRLERAVPLKETAPLDGGH